MGEASRREYIRRALGVVLEDTTSCGACHSGVVILRAAGDPVPMPCPHCQGKALSEWLEERPITKAELEAQAAKSQR